MSKTLNIHLLTIDGGTQSRSAIDEDVVAEYALAYEDDAELPEPVVFFDGSNNWLADGFHRYFAHLSRDKTTIIVDQRKGTRRDAVLYSLQANISHGLRPNNDDKRKAVGTMLADSEWAELSDRAIARHCGCSHNLVAKMRQPEMTVSQTAKLPSSGTNASAGKESAGTNASSTGAATGTNANALILPTGTNASAAEQITSSAHGDDDTVDDAVTLLEESYKEVAELRALLAVAEADDQKAETIKYKRIADVAQRRQKELMDTVNAREGELKRLMNTIRRVCAAAGEDDPTKIAAVIEANYRSQKVAA